MRALIPALLCSLVLVLPSSLHAAPGPVLEDPVKPEEEEGITTGYAIGSAVIGGFNAASILKNTAGSGARSRTWAYTGVVGGVLGMGLGVVNLVEDRSDEAKKLGAVNLGLGAVAAICGVLALRHPGDEAKAPPPAVVGQMRVHFGAGLAARGLGVRVTF